MKGVHSALCHAVSYASSRLGNVFCLRAEVCAWLPQHTVTELSERLAALVGDNVTFGSEVLHSDSPTGPSFVYGFIPTTK